MIRYGKVSDYAVPRDADTKLYQYAFLAEHLPRHATSQSRVLEVGANLAFEQLLALDVGERWVADPYDGAAGGGEGSVPPHPASITISRCTIGMNSDALPSDFFDVVFSSSVLEHVGQLEVSSDCFPLRRPPAAQEVPRDRLCRELFRVTRPGGVHLHTIDHAPRNLTYVGNFLRAGFVPLLDERSPTVRELLEAPDAVRQTRSWADPARPQPHQELHSVLVVGFRKPMGARPAAGPLPELSPLARAVGRLGGLLHHHLAWQLAVIRARRARA